MRVVLLSHNVGDYHAPRYLCLHNDLTELGHSLTIIEASPRSDFYNHTQNRAALLQQKLNIVRLGAMSPRELAPQVARTLPRLGPDAVIIPGYHDSFALTALICAKYLGIPAYFMSESKRDDQPRKWWLERIKGLIVRRFQGALVGGNRHKEYFSELGMRADDIAIGYDVIDNDFFIQRAASYRRKKSLIHKLGIVPERYILSVGRLVPRKRINLAIRIYAQSGLAEQGVDLIIIGSGPCEEEVRVEIKTHCLEERVHIRKNVPNKSMPLFYSLAEASILVSEYDQWGLAVNEAMACGTPVLVTERCGAANEIVHNNRNGFVWDGRDESEGAALLRRLVLDDSLRKRFGQAAIETMRHWGPPQFSAGLQSLLFRNN
jgi:glycosyltransferase involved in cell wall biosynthesis